MNSGGMASVWRNRRFAVGTILLAALLIRLFGMLFSPLEYDEIWSLENFSSLSTTRIFTDLALPNNHPLNSLFVKFWAAFAPPPQLIRLHSLVFGMLSVVLSGVLARGLFHNRRAARWSMFFMAFSAPAAAYSGLARGYSAQLCFLLLFACGLVWSGKLRRFLPGRFLPEAAMAAGAVGAVLAVPSAPIFLAAAGISAAAFSRKPPPRTTVFALAAAALAVAGYLALNYSALRQAQEWGSVLSSLDDWELFLGSNLAVFVPYAALPLLVLAALGDGRRTLLLFLCAALILGSAAVFRAGPARAYLPLCAVVALGCGRGTQLALRRTECRGRFYAAGAALLAVLLGYYGYVQLAPKWAVADYWGWFNAARLEPETTLVVFPASEGYPLSWNNRPELFEDYLRRLVCAAPGERSLLLFSGPGRINGMKTDGSETEMPLPFPGRAETLGGRTAYHYRLVPATETPEPGEPLLAVVPPIPERNLRLLIDGLNGVGASFLSLNPFFNLPRTGERGVMLSRLLFISAPERGLDRELLRAVGGKLYRILPVHRSIGG